MPFISWMLPHPSSFSCSASRNPTHQKCNSWQAVEAMKADEKLTAACAVHCSTSSARRAWSGILAMPRKPRPSQLCTQLHKPLLLFGYRPLWADLGSALNGTLENCVLTALIPLIHLTQNVLDFGISITLFKMPGTSEVNQM